jgi:hypothetical protein
LSGFFSHLELFKSRIDHSLTERARELGRLTTLLRSELPPECDGHFDVANIRDRTLVIMTDSPVWTTRLRQLGPTILTILQNSGRKNLLHIQVFSRPGQTAVARVAATAKTRPRQISAQSSQLLSQAASFIEDDSLREALLKLARHTADKPGSEHSD